MGLIPGIERSPGEGKGYPLQCSGLENPMDLYSPWGCKESATTERLSLSHFHLTSLVAQTVKCLSTMWETRVRSLGREDLLEKGMAIHSSTIIAWRIPWTEEPGRLQSMVHKEWDTTEAPSLSLSMYWMDSLLLLLLSRFSRVRLCATP